MKMWGVGGRMRKRKRRGVGKEGKSEGGEKRSRVGGPGEPKGYSAEMLIEWLASRKNRQRSDGREKGTEIDRDRDVD